MILVYFVCHQGIYIYTHISIYIQYGFCVLTAYVFGGFVSRAIEPCPYVCMDQFTHKHPHVQVCRQVVSMFLRMSSKAVHVFYPLISYIYIYISCSMVLALSKSIVPRPQNVHHFHLFIGLYSSIFCLVEFGV